MGMRDFLNGIKKQAETHLNPPTLTPEQEKTRKRDKQPGTDDGATPEAKKNDEQPIGASFLERGFAAARSGLQKGAAAARAAGDKLSEGAKGVTDGARTLAESAKNLADGAAHLAKDKIQEQREAAARKPSTGSGLLDLFVPAIPDTKATKPKKPPHTPHLPKK